MKDYRKILRFLYWQTCALLVDLVGMKLELAEVAAQIGVCASTHSTKDRL